MNIIEQNNEFGFYTRQSDGVSGMTVTTLADFCGTEQQTITQLLNRLRDSDPITNDLAECLKLFAGNDWRLITNDSRGSTFIMDEVCHAVLEYYALEARKYKGKAVAITNYRTVSKAGLRVFIWSQTSYNPVQEAQQPVLAPHKLALDVAEAIASIKDKFSESDPRLCQYLVDHALNSIPNLSQKALPATVWLGAVEIAEALGLPTNLHNRSQLGKFVKSTVGHLGKLEKRLCNGRMTEIMVYPDCEEVRSAVSQFFA